MINLQINSGKPLNIESAIWQLHIIYAAGEMQPIGEIPHSGEIVVNSILPYAGTRKYRASYRDYGNGKITVFYRGHQRTIKKLKTCAKCGISNIHTNEYCRICAYHEFVQ